MTQHTRRELLQRGSVGLAGVMAASAGCLDGLPLIGGSSYTDWLYAPRGDNSSNRYPVQMFDLNAIRKHEKHLSDGFNVLLEFMKEIIKPVDFESTNMIVSVDECYVARGKYARSDLDTSISKQGFTEQTTHNGYTLFDHTTQSPIGVSNTAVVFGPATEADAANKAVRLVIDAKKGTVKRYTDQNTAFATLSKHLTGDVIWTGNGPMSPSDFSPLARINGGSLTIQGEKSRITHVAVLNKNGPKNTSKIKQSIRSSAVNGVSFSKKKNVLLAETTKPTKDV